MENSTYQVVIIEVRDGLVRSAAVKNLAALFKTSSEQVENLLAVPGFVLKKGLTEEIAGKYKAAIEAAGAICKVQKEEQLEQFLDVDLPPASQTRSNKQAIAAKEVPRFSEFSFGAGDGTLKKAEEVNKGKKPNSIGMALGLLLLIVILIIVGVNYVKNRNDVHDVYGDYRTDSSVASVADSVSIAQEPSQQKQLATTESKVEQNTDLGDGNNWSPPKSGTWQCDNVTERRPWMTWTFASNGSYNWDNLEGFKGSGHYQWEGSDKLHIVDSDMSQTWYIIEGKGVNWLMSNGHFEVYCHQ